MTSTRLSESFDPPVSAKSIQPPFLWSHFGYPLMQTSYVDHPLARVRRALMPAPSLESKGRKEGKNEGCDAPEGKTLSDRLSEPQIDCLKESRDKDVQTST